MDEATLLFLQNGLYQSIQPGIPVAVILIVLSQITSGKITIINFSPQLLKLILIKGSYSTPIFLNLYHLFYKSGLLLGYLIFF